MSNGIYLKSGKEQDSYGEILLNSDPELLNPLNYTIYTLDRGVNVSNINIDKNSIIFYMGTTPVIKYMYEINNTKIFEIKDNNWVEININDYINLNPNSKYKGNRIYKNNIFQSIINDITQKTLDISNNWSYMMYGDNKDIGQRLVKKISIVDGYYRFTSDLGSTDFNINTGIPLRSLDIYGNSLNYIKFIVYKYDGYSQITVSDIDNIKNNFPTSSVNNLDYWVYDKKLNSEFKVTYILKNELYCLMAYTTTNHRAIGVCYNDDTSIKESKTGLFYMSPPPEGYRIYKKTGGINNFIQSINVLLIPQDLNFLNIPKISSTMTYEISNPINVYYINVPITNRIFVYQANNNKLLHITEYIPKGNTQKVTINYTNNNGVLNVTSSVVPVNPLPVPQFIYDGNSGYIGNFRGDDYSNMKCEPGQVVTNINYIKNSVCSVGPKISFECKNFYNTNNNVYNKLSLHAFNTGYINDTKIYFNDIIKIDTERASCTRGDYQNFTCPNNGIFSGVIQRRNNDMLTRLGFYCASPKIT